MIIERIPAGIYAVNCYILICEETKKAAIIDPGGDADEIIAYIEKNNLLPEMIILTHGHGDHIGAVQEIREKTSIPVCIHKDDADMLKDPRKNLTSLMGMTEVKVEADRLLADGDIVELGALKLHIIHTPGHTRGSICIRVNEVIFSGDTLFAQSIGRTDLEGGSFELIIDSIKRKLMVFNDETNVLPGHGASTAIGMERRMNPFINQ
ncbi:glyoxylase-like metal-dependent hydrolase (beta-lactamase superfamily II) [Anaerosolibacter carboniphilus]|uniref:Glyoxylase-like metal-dependent hydrolase (Beta-lactamase superfamily II) n=1 Tax=Anaerosolibacter carboniphilus TaxID=1417629 RepID=A0A841KLZ5_9FIRM|nr:glyoxylase-like metal-dependent hydrolase (beta-lactamase superfamily II) [Anaerosolibacter carboniphilus]